jgi:putative transcriptional regulator
VRRAEAEPPQRGQQASPGAIRESGAATDPSDIGLAGPHFEGAAAPAAAIGPPMAFPRDFIHIIDPMLCLVEAAGTSITSGMMTDFTSHAPSRTGYLDGQLLLAMPGMADNRFARSVIYVCAHSKDGAMGIVVNQPAKKVNFSELLVQLDVIAPDEAIRLPKRAGIVPVVKGGPVETGRGFVLHSADYFVDDSTLSIDSEISLTATVDILRAIACGNGPRQAMLALGYAGWSPGQLETEIQHNGWLNCPADPSLIFDTVLESKYERALHKLGIRPGMLSAEAGHA